MNKIIFFKYLRKHIFFKCFSKSQNNHESNTQYIPQIFEKVYVPQIFEKV